MATISLEAFDANLRGKYVQWIVTSSDNCSLPQGFQDQILSRVIQTFRQLFLFLVNKTLKRGYSHIRGILPLFLNQTLTGVYYYPFYSI